MDKPTIHNQCVEAAEHLIKHPEDARNAIEGEFGRNRSLFTQMDVFLRALGQYGPWSEFEQKQAQHEASQVMGNLFRKLRVVRFGPVVALSEPDYVRLAAQMVYAPADGPTEVKTPNGTFPRMFIYEDKIGRSGRRAGVARSDFEKWADQQIDTVTRIPATPALPKKGEERAEILRLRAELEIMTRRAETAEARVERLRAALGVELAS